VLLLTGSKLLIIVLSEATMQVLDIPT
jgi:hypothetical protein